MNRTSVSSYEVFAAAPSVSAIPLVAHVPHAGTTVPAAYRDAIVLTDKELAAELLVMTDHFTDVFGHYVAEIGGAAIINRVSRLVLDPERFRDDAAEAMAAKGMGAIYTCTSCGQSLRDESLGELQIGPQGEKFGVSVREQLLKDLYDPWHAAFEELVRARLEEAGRCLILDVHSFPSRALPYEDASRERPAICLGYDQAHAPSSLVAKLESVVRQHGLQSACNTPFSGSMVPAAFYGTDSRVSSLMIELNRGLYMDEATGERGKEFDVTSALFEELVDVAASWVVGC